MFKRHHKSECHSEWTLPPVPSLKHSKGQMLKRLVTANPAHTLWHNISPLNHICKRYEPNETGNLLDSAACAAAVCPVEGGGGREAAAAAALSPLTT